MFDRVLNTPLIFFMQLTFLKNEVSVWLEMAFFTYLMHNVENGQKHFNKNLL